MLKFIITIFSVAVLFFAANNLLCSANAVAPELSELKNISISDFDEDSLNLLVTVAAINKNDFDITIKNFFTNIIYRQDSIGTTEREKEFTIPASDTFDVKLAAFLSTKKILKLSSDAPDFININLAGTADADLGIITLPVNIDLDYSFNPKENISKTVQMDVEQQKIISVKKAVLKSISMDKSIVEIEFEIKNPYGINFSVNEYPSTIFINDFESGDGTLGDTIFVETAGSSISGSMIYEMNNVKTLTNLIGSIFKRELAYKTKGMLDLTILDFNLKLPYSFEGVLVKI